MNQPYSTRIPIGLRIAAFAKSTGYTVAELKSPRRTHNISHDRQRLMAFLSIDCGYNMAEIGEALNRDCTTVKYGIAKADNRGMVPAICYAIEDGLGVEDIAASGMCSIIDARRAVDDLRADGSLARFYGVPKGASA